ncbi:cholesterol 24-hydroxylase-like isoform X2 [Ptychodera flava]|uniref:cholesterol 24-hydroxylase-like isoform X2 n=1 Tax=Ptychodera flava TaxID=63121 RepID=UPI00396A238C
MQNADQYLSYFSCTGPLCFLHTQMLLRYMGYGLISEIDHSQWTRKRNALNPAFNRKFLMEFMSQFNESCDVLLDFMSNKTDQTTQFKMLDLFERLTMDIIAKVAFDIDLGAVCDANQPLSKAISSTFNAVAHLIRNPHDQINPFAASFRKQVRAACELLRNTGNKCVEERIQAINSGSTPRQDILTYIIKSTNEDDDIQVQIEEMVDQFVTIFIAGMETTANQLSFALIEICKHPEVLARIRKEVDCILQSKNHVTFEDLNSLQYLGQVLKETLRLYPPVFAATRILSNDVTYLGYHLPAGTEVTVNTFQMCRMEEYYENALQFDPDRFAPDRERPMFTYFPFSLGPRVCIGQHLSQMEAKVVMAKLLYEFDFKLVPGQSFELLERATLKPKDGVMVTIRPRDRVAAC